MLIRFLENHPSGILAGTVADLSTETATALIAEGVAERATKQDLKAYHDKAAADREEAAEKYLENVLAERAAKAAEDAKAKAAPRALTDAEKVKALEETTAKQSDTIAEHVETINQLRADIALLEAALINK